MYYSENGDMERIREGIFKYLQDNQIPKPQAGDVLVQCLNFVRNTIKIRRLAEDLGLELDGFLSNKELELYYEIKKEDRHICVIYKGWADPGFRLSEILTCHPKNVELVKGNIGAVLRTCANEGITIGVDATSQGLGIELAINIYQEGFNTGVLKEALKTMESTTNKVKKMITC
ncbi:MAG: hypothetical protein HY762_03435 [Planctomycetes bacterium]|nr:hypothetical protein [Planctomycetota bacterium]